MAICNKCGASVDENSSFCHNCGNSLCVDDERTLFVGGQVYNPSANPQPAPQQPINPQPVQQPVYQQPINPQPVQQPVYQQPVNPQPVQQPVYQQPVNPQPAYQQPMNPQYGYQNPLQPQLSMKWFNFLIYFSLFAGALLNFGTGISLLTGMAYETAYGNAKELVYAFYEGLEFIDTTTAILSFALSFFGIYVRFRLSQYRVNGPKMLINLYTASLAVGLFYVIGFFIVTEGEVDSFASMGASVAINIAMIGLNKKYFDNRKHLFVN